MPRALSRLGSAAPFLTRLRVTLRMRAGSRSTALCVWCACVAYVGVIGKGEVAALALGVLLVSAWLGERR